MACRATTSCTSTHPDVVCAHAGLQNLYDKEPAMVVCVFGLNCTSLALQHCNALLARIRGGTAQPVGMPMLAAICSKRANQLHVMQPTQ